MDQIENIAPLVRLSDIAGMIAPHAGDIRDREARVWGAVPYMGVCYARQASPRRHGYKVCRDLAAGR